MAKLDEIISYINKSDIKFAIDNEDISIQVHKRKKGDNLAIDNKRSRIQISERTDDRGEPKPQT